MNELEELQDQIAQSLKKYNQEVDDYDLAPSPVRKMLVNKRFNCINHMLDKEFKLRMRVLQGVGV